MAQDMTRRDMLRNTAVGMTMLGAASGSGAESPIVAGQPGLMLTPGPSGWWDSERVSCPRVLRETDGSWKMWYYGRDSTFDRSIVLPTGRIGLATSRDGVRWTRVRGPGVMGSVMDPAADQSRFDAAFVAVSDVRRTSTGYDMAYFGGGETMGSIAGRVSKGFPARAGRAVSRDGVHWIRQQGPFLGAMLDVGAAGAFDSAMIGWPQIVHGKDGGWRLYYHTVSAEFGVAVGLATSDDGGKSWRKVGPVLTRGPEGAFDEIGPATRQVFVSGGRYVMLYEGVGKGNLISIGLAVSDDGEHWIKVKGPLKGGAVFTPSAIGATDADSPWDSRAVGTPWVVAMPDGGHRLYYVGNKRPPAGVAVSELTIRHQIGLAVAEGNDFLRWRRWGADERA